MKIISLIGLALAFALVMTCKGEAAGKTLVVYFSLSGNTEELARHIHSVTGGDIFRIETAEPYPDGYDATVEQAKKELEAGARPALRRAKVERLSDYDTVFIGSPNWWSSIPTPVMTFLEANDFSGKTVAQFVTHGGGGLANCARDLRRLCSGAEFTEPFVVGGSRAAGARADVERWMSGLGLLK